MGVATAAIVGGAIVGGAAIQYFGAQNAAHAAQNAASAQADEAKNQRNTILAQGNKNQAAALKLADATPQELGALDRSYAAATSDLERSQRLIASLDPSVMEASQQALKLLRGENAGITDAASAQRTQQRQSLVNSLRAQYGPGAETSSVGQRALRAFDLESDTLTQSLNSNALNQVFGIANTDINAQSRSAQSALQQVGQGYGALQERKLNTQINTGNSIMAALSGTSASMIQAAGAPYVGAALQGQAMSSLGGNIMNVGAQVAGGYATGYGQSAGKGAA